MSLITALDATNICARWSGPLSDPASWVAGDLTPRRTDVAAPAPAFSWWALAPNPQALVISGLVSLAVAGDSVLRLGR
jgi:hypothetical protein